MLLLALSLALKVASRTNARFKKFIKKAAARILCGPRQIREIP